MGAKNLKPFLEIRKKKKKIIYLYIYINKENEKFNIKKGNNKRGKWVILGHSLVTKLIVTLGYNLRLQPYLIK